MISELTTQIPYINYFNKTYWFFTEKLYQIYFQLHGAY